MSPSLLDAPGLSGVCLYVCARVCVWCVHKDSQSHGGGRSR